MDYVLTEGDKLLLQNLVRDVENLKARIARLTSNELDDPRPTGGFVGYTTSIISAKVEEPGTGVLDRPGCGFVDLYKAVLYGAAGTGGAGSSPGTGTGSQFSLACDIDYEMRKIGVNRRVLNMSSGEIDGGVWVWIDEDRFGNFWVIGKFTIKTKCVTVVDGCDAGVQTFTTIRVINEPC